jgi:hypothetical protein
MRDRQGASVQRVCEQNIVGKTIIERQRRAIPILTAQHHEGRVAMGTGPRGDEQCEEIREPHAAPPQRPTRPGRHAVKIGSELDARQTAEFVLNRYRLLGFVADLEGDPARVAGKAPRKLAHSEAREPVDCVLSWRQCHACSPEMIEPGIQRSNRPAPRFDHHGAQRSPQTRPHKRRAQNKCGGATARRELRPRHSVMALFGQTADGAMRRDERFGLHHTGVTIAPS